MLFAWFTLGNDYDLSSSKFTKNTLLVGKKVFFPASVFPFSIGVGHGVTNIFRHFYVIYRSLCQENSKQLLK